MGKVFNDQDIFFFIKTVNQRYSVYCGGCLLDKTNKLITTLKTGCHGQILVYTTDIIIIQPCSAINIIFLNWLTAQ